MFTGIVNAVYTVSVVSLCVSFLLQFAVIALAYRVTSEVDNIFDNIIWEVTTLLQYEYALA